MSTNKFSIAGLIGVHVSSTVNEAIKTISSQFIFFLWKYFEHTKPQIKPKPHNKRKLSEQKTTKATSFHALKLLSGEKLVILRLLKKWPCPDNLIYYTTLRTRYTQSHKIKTNLKEKICFILKMHYFSINLLDRSIKRLIKYFF